MEKPNTRLHDENNGPDYVLVGDYYFPALILAEDSRPVGRWGRMYKRYLKEHHSARYQALLLSGRLNTIWLTLMHRQRNSWSCLLSRWLNVSV